MIPNQTSKTSYPLPAEIIRKLAVLLDIKSESKGTNKKLDEACLDIFLDKLEVDKPIKTHISQPIRKKVSEQLASKLQEALGDFIEHYYKIVVHNQPETSREETLHWLFCEFVAADLLKLLKSCLPKASLKIDDFILGKPSGNKTIVLDTDGFKNSSAISFVMEYLQINNAWMDNKGVDKRMVMKWKSGDAIPSLYSLINYFDKNTQELELMFIARAIDEFRKHYYEFFEHLVNLILVDKTKSFELSNKDQKVNKALAQINAICNDLTASNKTSAIKQQIRENLDTLSVDRTINHYPQVQAKLHRVNAMYHLFDGDKITALKEIKCAINKWLFNNQVSEKLLDEALTIGSIQDSPDKVFLKKVYKAKANFGFAAPINQKDSKGNKSSDHIQDWQIEDWKKLSHPDLLFEGVKQYDIKITNPTEPLLTVIGEHKPDYRYPNRKIKVGTKDRRQVAYPQLVHFVTNLDYGIVQKLLNRSADVNKLSSSKDSAINCALLRLSPTATGVPCRDTAKKIVDLLLTEPYRSQHKKETVNTRTEKLKYAPLHSAIDAGEPDYVEALLEMGADVNMKATTNELSPLYYCVNTLNIAKISPEELLAMIDRPNATLEEKDAWHRHGNDFSSQEIDSELFNLVLSHQYQQTQSVIDPENMYRIAELLLQQGANPNQQHNSPHGYLKDYTPLMFCAETDESDLFRLMLKYGGDVNQTCSGGVYKQVSVFQIAQYWQSKSVLKILEDLKSN